MRYKGILFDMDGTVLETLRDLNSAINHTMEHFGYKTQSLEQTKYNVGNGSRRLIERSVPAGTSDGEIERILDYYLPYYNAHSNETTAPYDGITELMKALKAEGLRLAIVSNKPDETVRELSEVYFSGLLETGVGENERKGIRRKPAPDTALSAAALMGLEPGECLYVGDSEVDVLTAKNAGMDCASVLWGFRTEQELREAGAKLFFSTPEELGEFIMKK